MEFLTGVGIVIGIILFIVGLFNSKINGIITSILGIVVAVFLFSTISSVREAGSKFEAIEIWGIIGAIFGFIRGLGVAIGTESSTEVYFFATYYVEATEEHPIMSRGGALFGTMVLWTLFTGLSALAVYNEHGWVGTIAAIAVPIYCIGCTIKAFVA